MTAGPFSLAGRTALITGATGGIGTATAKLFAQAGAEIILTSDDQPSLNALGDALRSDGHVVHTLVADLSSTDGARDLAASATRLAGQVDILVSNAGMEGHVGPIGEASDEAIDRLFNVNLRAAMTLTSVLAPAMAKRGHGNIVLVASIAGVRGNKAIGLYGVSKAALAQLGRTLAVEWGPQGIRVNTISPGVVRTPFAKPILDNPEYLARRMSLTPLRRPGEPEEIAGSILYLASDASGFVTGHNLIADGGTTISDGN
jgi:NAD(P)-dependent dehydrogenase (short-subunit alcohol dehydrogenase family)